MRRRRTIGPGGAALFLLLALLLGLPIRGRVATESSLARDFTSQIKPFFEGQFVEGSLATRDGLTLRYVKRPAAHPQGVLVLVPGRTEFAAKYAELAYDLRDLPVSIYILDLRGQGLSSRMLADHDKGYVGAFNDYVDDLARFLDTVVRPEQRGPLVLLTHSLGGAIACLYADAHPERVQGLILCSPMLAINTRPLPAFAARLLAGGMVDLGLGGRYLPRGGPYNPKKPFARNDLTGSRARFDLNRRLVAENPANSLGSPTFAWLYQAFIGMGRLAAHHRRLTMPILLLQAGDDTVVGNAAQNDLCRKLPHCTLITLAGAKHEILMERDGIRNQAIALIRDFENTHGEARP